MCYKLFPIICNDFVTVLNDPTDTKGIHFSDTQTSAQVRRKGTMTHVVTTEEDEGEGMNVGNDR